MNNCRKTLLKVPVDTYQPQEFISKVEKNFHSPDVKVIFAVNPEKIVHAGKDPELLSALKEADYLIPDGIGVIFGLRLIYRKRIARITGIGFMKSLLDLAVKKDSNVFIYGSRPQVNEKASDNILKHYLSLRLVGREHGYIPEEKYEALVERINGMKTDILFVGLGSPKQEKWIHRYRRFLKIRVCMGIGGSLDVIAGNIPRAPDWIKNRGLEWLYRLIREPSRFKRQMVLPKFALAILKEKISS